MLALTGVKSYFPNSFPLLQVKPFILLTVSLVAEKKNVQDYVVTFGVIGQFKEQGQLVILKGSIFKGSRPFYWILLKATNLNDFVFYIIVKSLILARSVDIQPCFITVFKLICIFR